jgi:hypothetical protein
MGMMRRGLQGLGATINELNAAYQNAQINLANLQSAGAPASQIAAAGAAVVAAANALNAVYTSAPAPTSVTTAANVTNLVTNTQQTAQQAQATQAAAIAQAAADKAKADAAAALAAANAKAVADAQAAAAQAAQTATVTPVTQTAATVAAAPTASPSPYTDSQLVAGANTIPWSSSIPDDQLQRIGAQINANLAQFQRQGIVEGSVLAYMLGLGSGQPDGAVIVAPSGQSYTVSGGVFVLTSSIPMQSTGSTTSSGASTPLTPVAGGNVVVDSTGQVSGDASFPLLPVLIGGGVLAFFVLGGKK